MILLVVIYLAFPWLGSRQGADPWLWFYGILLVSALPLGILLYLFSFEVKRWEDSDFSPYASE